MPYYPPPSSNTAVTDSGIILQRIKDYVLDAMDLSSPTFQTFISGNRIGFLWGRNTNDNALHEDGTYTVPTGKTLKFGEVGNCGLQSENTTNFQSIVNLNSGAYFGVTTFQGGTYLESGGGPGATGPDTVSAGGVLSFQTKANNAAVYAWVIAKVS